VIAVAAPDADPAEVRKFVADHYGDAPVRVFLDPTGRDFEALGGGEFPSAAFFDAAGNRVEAFEGWPGFIGRHL
jgi:hypothetical protein